MKTNKFLLLAALLVPMSVTAFACGHRPDDEGFRPANATVVFVGEKNRGYLGVAVDEVTPKLARRKNLTVEAGVYVNSVTRDSPADDAGIKEGDVIVEYDGKNVYDNDDLVSEVRRTKPGTEVQIAIQRGGERKYLKASVARLPREPKTFSFTVPSPPRMRMAPHFSWNNSSSVYGLTMEELNWQLGEYFGTPDGNGLLVKNVKRGSEADKAGFKAGDVIVKIGKDDVDKVSDVWEVLREYRDGEKAEFEIIRKGKTEKLTLTIDEDSQRDLSLRGKLDGDDIIIDLVPDGGGFHFRQEADKMKRNGEKLKRNLEHMKKQLHDEMIDLKEKIRRKVDLLRLSADV